MICSYVPEGIPVLCGFPTGHDDVNLPLVMGAPVTLDVTASGASLTFGMNGRQAKAVNRSRKARSSADSSALSTS